MSGEETVRAEAPSTEALIFSGNISGTVKDRGRVGGLRTDEDDSEIILNMVGSH